MPNSDSDSGDENDRHSAGEGGLNLAGFLFGNIGQDGELEDSFLDEASKRKLGGLQQILGLGNLIQDEDLVGNMTRLAYNIMSFYAQVGQLILDSAVLVCFTVMQFWGKQTLLEIPMTIANGVAFRQF